MRGKNKGGYWFAAGAASVILSVIFMAQATEQNKYTENPQPTATATRTVTVKSVETKKVIPETCLEAARLGAKVYDLSMKRDGYDPESDEYFELLQQEAKYGILLQQKLALCEADSRRN